MLPSHHVDILFANILSVTSQIKSEVAVIQHSVGLKLVQSLARKFTGSQVISDAEIKRREYGKPYVESGPYFNIAHSGELVIAAVCADCEIGIDIEHIRTVEWREYESMFTRDEWTTIVNSLNPSYTFLDLWVKKESILKAEGSGLQIPLVNVIIGDDHSVIQGKAVKLFPVSVPVHNHICYLTTFFPNMMVTVREAEYNTL